MNPFSQKIMNTHFGKLIRKLLLATLIVVVGSGAVCAYAFSPQISQLYALETAGSTASLTPSADNTSPAIEQMQQHDRHDHNDDLESLIESGAVTQPSTGALAAGLICLILCCACAAAWWLLSPAWLYKASVQAGMNPLFWPLLGLALSPIALVIFLLARSRLQHCPSCGSWQKADEYCGTCGKKLLDTCPFCGAQVDTAKPYCPKCGTALNGETSPVAPFPQGVQ